MNVTVNVFYYCFRGFGAETIKFSDSEKDGKPEDLPLMSKREVAERFWLT